MSGTKFYDLIVIGGGAMGLATAYHASKSQNVSNVLVLEQYAFYNELSSSGGSSRQFRLQYEEDYMAKLVLAAIPYWDELQAHTDITLRTKVGSLWFGAADVQSSEGQINAARNVLDQLNLPYQNLCAAEIENEFQKVQLAVLATVALADLAASRMCGRAISNLLILTDFVAVDEVCRELVSVDGKKQRFFEK